MPPSFNPHCRSTRSATRGPIGQDDAPAAESYAQDEAFFVAQIKETADKLLKDEASRGDVKLLASIVKELRYCFKVFQSLKGTRKVTIFGSARTKPDHPAFKAAVEFGRQISDEGFLVITGAASGIMEAGHVGAGREKSIGINIRLPFEQSSNPIITGDNKLMTLRYFFTRKLLFVKECDAVVLFPGGFGTHDEGFEALTLVQTGKSHLFPIVFLDEPNGTYWETWQRFILKELHANQYISDADLALYRVTDSVAEAAREVSHFYRVYHSMRYVGKDLVLRLNRDVPREHARRNPRALCRYLQGGRFQHRGGRPDGEERRGDHALAALALPLRPTSTWEVKTID